MTYKVKPTASCAGLFDRVIDTLRAKDCDIVEALVLVSAKHTNNQEPNNSKKSRKRTLEGWPQREITRFSVRFRYGIDEQNQILWINTIETPSTW